MPTCELEASLGYSVNRYMFIEFYSYPIWFTHLNCTFLWFNVFTDVCL